MDVLTNVDNHETYPKISSSEHYSIARCKKLWDYSYRQGLVPNSTPDYLSKGSFYHSLIAQYLTSPEDLSVISADIQRQSLLDKEPTVTEPDRLSATAQIKDFFDTLGTPSPDAIVAVEQEFFVDIGFRRSDGTPVLLHGFIDAAIRDDTGNVWIVEHKTAARAWSAQQLEMAYQDVLYCKAWEVLTGERPVGVQYNFFYPKRWEVKHKFIGEEQYDGVVADVQAAITLRDTLTSYPREPLWGCSGCQFRNLCFTELTGGDATYIRENEFVVDKDRAARFSEGD